MRLRPPRSLQSRLVLGFGVIMALILVGVAALIDLSLPAFDVLEEPLEAAAIVVLAAAILIGAGAYLMARQAVAPIRKLAQRLAAMTTEDLSTPVSIEGADPEFQALVDHLNALLHRLQSGFELQRRFLSDTAHEIQSPLTVMKGNLEVALRYERSPHDYREVLADNLEETNRLIRLAQDLLLLARLGSGRAPLAVRDVDAAEAIHGVVRLIGAEAGAKGVTVAVDAGPALLRADPDRLRQILWNLIRNALAYTPRGGRVGVTARHAAAEVRIVVEDTGIGIPEKDQPLVFQPFYRVATARDRDGGGSGLGLAIVRQLTEAQGGRVELESREGFGSRFSVILPAATAEPPVKNVRNET